jgi:hypothetical protein
LVSTTTTPLAVTKTPVLPPPPFITYRLSFSFSISTRGAAAAGACCSAAADIDTAPTATSRPSTRLLFMMGA